MGILLEGLLTLAAANLDHGRISLRKYIVVKAEILGKQDYNVDIASL